MKHHAMSALPKGAIHSDVNTYLKFWHAHIYKKGESINIPNKNTRLTALLFLEIHCHHAGNTKQK
jgi:hypothetical protein